ncbi:ATP-binding cassette domain-containing protein [Arthrobacter zhangbolii]|uniref:ABC-type quaternary amine transporter n=1 Tax=Arthrobacter zhangbolii TaxID=2886936 RepID=A0A9X1M7M4_9MICC|nr:MULTISPECIES: ATP-binding cassette domain-containing protein [Arthrobacter]MCC3272375.1 ATP-binding cassette domain-containing protein [Arthrobacter zhangbolii]MDN3903440.1 ATP-binding cassette domain-containing protein [Arthrobacter sp. YD2]UON91762.1 ATP-binding cassette domain-containing protein [Arthrobacter zhangbolii]
MSETEIPSNGGRAAGAGILLEDVTKRFPGQEKPAVGGLTMEIPQGSIVMLVGPSGCGKTTTLKMINRLIEPTSGRIILNGEDVTGIDGDQLRRGIGYVIQAGGLFPHMTVAANIAVVPKMLNWDKERIRSRVDELLELVSLDPALYRDRYPKELSGGQQQRVGVARALAADPPVLLMDEPFGAVDPITRQRLQDELLHIQSELHKTIVCVTHDFDEAVKLGDWIAIFDEGAQLVQYDSPERILASPANEFVENFIGSGAGLKQLTLTRVNEVDLVMPVTASVGDLTSDTLSRLQGAGEQNAVVLDERGRPIQWLSRRQLSRLDRHTDAVDPRLPVIGNQATLNDALDTMLVSSTGAALVTGPRESFLGMVTVQTVMEAITAANDAAQQGSSSAPVGINSGMIQRAGDPVPVQDVAGTGAPQ